jgi:hypothetical protein
MMPPAPEPSQASELANAGIERVPPTSPAMSLSATAMIQGAPSYFCCPFQIGRGFRPGTRIADFIPILRSDQFASRRLAFNLADSPP